MKPHELVEQWKARADFLKPYAENDREFLQRRMVLIEVAADLQAALEEQKPSDDAKRESDRADELGALLHRARSERDRLDRACVGYNESLVEATAEKKRLEHQLAEAREAQRELADGITRVLSVLSENLFPGTTGDLKETLAKYAPKP